MSYFCAKALRHNAKVRFSPPDERYTETRVPLVSSTESGAAHGTSASQVSAFLFASSCNTKILWGTGGFLDQGNDALCNTAWSSSPEILVKQKHERCRAARTRSFAVHWEHTNSFLTQISAPQTSANSISRSNNGIFLNLSILHRCRFYKLHSAKRWSIMNTKLSHAALSSPHRLTKSYSNTVSQQYSTAELGRHLITKFLCLHVLLFKLWSQDKWCLNFIKQ